MRSGGWKPFWAALFASLLVLVPLVGGTVLLSRQQLRTQLRQAARSESGVPIQLPKTTDQLTVLLCVSGEQPGFVLAYLNASQNCVHLLSVPAVLTVPFAEEETSLARCYAAAGPARCREALAQVLALPEGTRYLAFSPDVLKQKDPEARMCFIGPCAAKKLEASRRTVRSDVDFVLTFEELAGIIEAKDVDTSLLEVDEAEALHAASAAGRGFAQSGGVAKAVADKIKEWHPDMDVKIASAQGLAECKKLLMLAKAGKYNGYLLEGMGCPGGCIGGAGTIADPARTAIQLNKYVKEAPFADPEQSPFMSEIHVLKDDPDFEL